MNHSRFETTADLVLCNARVITQDSKQPSAELVAIKSGRILAAGDKYDLALFKGATTKVIDCQGGTIIPGFNDAHCHPLALASSLLSVDCSPRVVLNIAQIQARIRHQAEQTEEGKWIRAAGYDEFYLQEKRPPDRGELDQAALGHPMVLFHGTGQRCILNSLALQLASITRDTPQPASGLIQKDPQTGEPTGLIFGRNEQVKRSIPPLDEEELERGMKLVDRQCLSRGITSLQDTSWTNSWRHWQTWQRLVERGLVSPRVSMLIGTESLEEFQSSGLAWGSGNERLSVGGLKLALDESTGCPHPPQEDLNRLALRAYEAGFPIAFHVNDAFTLEASLGAMKLLCQRVPRAEHRFRLEHCAFCPPALLLRLKASRAIVVTQPSFLYFMGQKHMEEFAPEQTKWLYPIGSCQRLGIKVAFSSDSPLVSSDPLTGLYAAVTRRTEEGQEFTPRERISPWEALKMYTLGGAYASFEEGVKGSISPGKFADLAVLSRDPTQVAPEQLRDLKVVRTIIDGEVVWES